MIEVGEEKNCDNVTQEIRYFSNGWPPGEAEGVLLKNVGLVEVEERRVKQCRSLSGSKAVGKALTFVRWGRGRLSRKPFSISKINTRLSNPPPHPNKAS